MGDREKWGVHVLFSKFHQQFHFFYINYSLFLSPQYLNLRNSKFINFKTQINISAPSNYFRFEFRWLAKESACPRPPIFNTILYDKILIKWVHLCMHCVYPKFVRSTNNPISTNVHLQLKNFCTSSFHIRSTKCWKTINVTATWRLILNTEQFFCCQWIIYLSCIWQIVHHFQVMLTQL